MKIVHLIPTYAPAWKYGGPVRSVSGLCEGLAAGGHDVTVLTTDAGLRADDIPARSCVVIRNGVKVYYFPRVAGLGIKSPALEHAAGELVRGQDLVHVTAIWQRTGPAMCHAARRAGIPYVISPRGALGPYSWGRGRLKKIAYYFLYERENLRRAAGFHYTSLMEAKECEGFRFGKPACTIPNPMDLDFWKPDRAAGQAWRKMQGFENVVTVLLYAGRIHHKKGLDLLPDALRHCERDGLATRLVFVGPEDDETGMLLRKKFAELGLEHIVTFLPMVPPEELRVIYCGADIFVLPSRHENFGNVAVEAAACGCQVLASSNTGVAQELVDLGIGQSLPNNALAWYRAITESTGKRRDVTNFGQNRVLKGRFGLESVAKGMEKFYSRVLQYCGKSPSENGKK